MKNLKFDFRKCYDWVNSIEEDFSISGDVGNFVMRGNNVHNLLERISLKVFLQETIIEFKDESLKMSDSEFLKLLNDLYKHWQNEQYRIINYINNQIVRLKSKKRKEKEDLIKQYLIFFQCNYTLINMIKSDVLNNYHLSETVERINKGKKQPSAKIIMEVIRQIEDYSKEKFLPKEYNSNTEKFNQIASIIKNKFEFVYSGGTLENQAHKFDSSNSDDVEKVIDILNEFGYSSIATKFKNRG